MLLDNILGYWVTDDPDVLTHFIDQARAHYAAIEEHLVPISAAVSDLEHDWLPRSPQFWRKTASALYPLREATKACLALFDKERSSLAAPVPIILSATSLGYVCSLHHIEGALEEAGIRLTAYTPSITGAGNEAHIRQRQRVLEALRTLDQQAKKALIDGRTRLDQATSGQQALCAPRPADRQARQIEQPILHVVPQVEVES